MHTELATFGSGVELEKKPNRKEAEDGKKVDGPYVSEEHEEGERDRLVEVEPEEFSWILSNVFMDSFLQVSTALTYLEQVGCVSSAPQGSQSYPMILVEEVLKGVFIGGEVTEAVRLKGLEYDLTYLEHMGGESVESKAMIVVEVGVQKDCMGGRGTEEDTLNVPGDSGVRLSCPGGPKGTYEAGLEVGFPCQQECLSGMILGDGPHEADASKGPLGAGMGFSGLLDNVPCQRALKLVLLDELDCEASSSKFVASHSNKPKSVASNRNLPEAAHKTKKGKLSEFSSSMQDCREPSDLADFTLSDDDIAYHNNILRKAVSTWEVSSQLGIVFKLHREAIVEHFARLEKERRVLIAE